mmetsp:Transcript_115821/g.310556  ORF Transcript_115821/g.310556 Transcript_115821/m.310556 type:complete len:262 (+) Transcript_115821:198-983(+)
MSLRLSVPAVGVRSRELGHHRAVIRVAGSFPPLGVRVHVAEVAQPLLRAAASPPFIHARPASKTCAVHQVDGRAERQRDLVPGHLEPERVAQDELPLATADGHLSFGARNEHLIELVRVACEVRGPDHDRGGLALPIRYWIIRVGLALGVGVDVRSQTFLLLDSLRRRCGCRDHVPNAAWSLGAARRRLGQRLQLGWRLRGPVGELGAGARRRLAEYMVLDRPQRPRHEQQVQDGRRETAPGRRRRQHVRGRTPLLESRIA